MEDWDWTHQQTQHRLTHAFTQILIYIPELYVGKASERHIRGEEINFTSFHEILPFAIWKDLEGIIRSEISQKEKDKYGKISLLCAKPKKPN